MIMKPCDNGPVLKPCTLEGRNFQVDPYIGCGHYCYYCYALNQAETNWKKEIIFHKDIISQLEFELAGLPSQTIYLGWETDPYQPCEVECRQTRQVLELLLERGYSASILTKSDLVLRDMDLLQKMNEATISTSVAFNDNDVRQLFEGNTVDTEDRINALIKFKTAGLKTAALICPVIPYITDVIPLLNMVAPHTDKIWIYGLSMQKKTDRNWQNVETILKNHFPDLRSEVETVVFSKDHSYWVNLRQELIGLQKDMNLSIHL